MPTSVSLMLCTLIKEPFNDKEWLYEVKWDGYRIIALINKEKVILKSRGDQNYTSKYSPVSKSLKELKYDAVIDGEVVVLDENGQPDFSALQNYRLGNAIAFYGFDLLWCNGHDLMRLPLSDRKDLLKQILPVNDIIKYSESFDDGLELFNTAKNLGVEGIVAKKRDSIYTPARKGNTWYKAKHSLRQEYVIGGWAESDKRPFRSLLFGHYVNGEFTYVHHSGGGFMDKQMKELSEKLKKLEIKESPFVNKVDLKAKLHWAKPVLVAEFEKSTNTTASGKIRHPAIFIALREDKKARDVVEEVPEIIKPPKKTSKWQEQETKQLKAQVRRNQRKQFT
ncbi:MAG: non-homologous end-joining DNA ligase [Ginsengibacter sp.]